MLLLPHSVIALLIAVVYDCTHPIVRADGQRVVPLRVADLRVRSGPLGLFSAEHPLVVQVPGRSSEKMRTEN